MLSGEWSAKMLKWLLNQEWAYTSGSTGTKTNPGNSGSPFPTRLYLAFFTAAPTVDASGNVTSYAEPTCGGSGEEGSYHRVELTALGLEGNRLLSAPDYVERKIGIYDSPSDANPSETVTKKVARLRNHTEVIMFPYTGKSTEAHAGYTAPITHFGIFGQGTGGSPIFYGPLESSVTVAADRVPVLLRDAFEITLG